MEDKVFARICEQIEKHDYISFDVFDTLLLRPFVIPSDLFDYIEYKHHLPGFSKARKGVIVEEGVIEKSIEDIYRNIGEPFRNCMDVELAEEARLIYAAASMRKVFDYAVKAEKHIVIISDIYFHAPFIEKLLSENGYSGFCKVYASCDLQKTKCKGDLYDYVVGDLRIKNAQLLHIGDNEVSDYAVPQSKGIDAILVRQNFQKYCDYRQYLCGFHGAFQESFLHKVCADNYAEFENRGGISGSDDCWYRFGHDIAGPVCWTYARWLRQVVDEGGEFSDLAFIARDGYLLKKMFDQLPGKCSVRTHYIYAPRILTTLLQENYVRKCDVQQLSKEERDKIDQVYGLQGLSADEREKYVSLLGEAYRNYLRKENFGKKKIGVVDSSTDNLSSQKLINIFTDNQETCGLYWYATQNAFLPDYEIRTCQKEHYMAVESPSLFELIFKDPLPPVRKFLPDGTVDYCVLTGDEADRIHNFEFLEKGAMDFYAEAESRKMDLLVEAEVINRYLNDYCRNPSAREKELIETGCCSGGIANDQWSRVSVFIKGKRPFNRKEFKRSIKRKLAMHPGAYVFLREIYHKFKHT